MSDERVRGEAKQTIMNDPSVFINQRIVLFEKLIEELTPQQLEKLREDMREKLASHYWSGSPQFERAVAHLVNNPMIVPHSYVALTVPGAYFLLKDLKRIEMDDGEEGFSDSERDDARRLFLEKGIETYSDVEELMGKLDQVVQAFSLSQKTFQNAPIIAIPRQQSVIYDTYSCERKGPCQPVEDSGEKLVKS